MTRDEMQKKMLDGEWDFGPFTDAEHAVIHDAVKFMQAQKISVAAAFNVLAKIFPLLTGSGAQSLATAYVLLKYMVLLRTELAESEIEAALRTELDKLFKIDKPREN